MPNKNENKKSHNMCIKNYRRFNAPFNYKEFLLAIVVILIEKQCLVVGHIAQQLRLTIYVKKDDTSNMNHLIYHHLFRSYAGTEFQEYCAADVLFDLIMKNISDIIYQQMIIVFSNARSDYKKENW